MAEASIVEETFKRLTAHKGVEGVLVLTGEGILIRSTLESALSTQYAGWVDPNPYLIFAVPCVPWMFYIKAQPDEE